MVVEGGHVHKDSDAVLSIGPVNFLAKEPFQGNLQNICPWPGAVVVHVGW